MDQVRQLYSFGGEFADQADPVNWWLVAAVVALLLVANVVAFRKRQKT